MDDTTKRQLQWNAEKIRLHALEGIYGAASGHPGGSLSIADLLSYLYFYKMKVDPKNTKDPNRDRFVLSKGHCAPALYGALALKGYFPEEACKTLRKMDSFLQGHPDMKGTPGVDMSTGSLGQGISAACGMALNAKLDGLAYRVYAILGDGELEEGEVWEAAMFAAHYKLDNFTAMVDFNGLQIDGKITDVMSPCPIDKKFEGFGFHVIQINGHDFVQIDKAFAEAEQTKGKPTVIICHNIKGKGVSFMENEAGWHGNAPSREQYEQAVSEIQARIKSLEVAE